VGVHAKRNGIRVSRRTMCVGDRAAALARSGTAGASLLGGRRLACAVCIAAARRKTSWKSLTTTRGRSSTTVFRHPPLAALQRTRDERMQPAHPNPTPTRARLRARALAQGTRTHRCLRTVAATTLACLPCRVERRSSCMRTCERPRRACSRLGHARVGRRGCLRSRIAHVVSVWS
jgi:hypothetical protein